MIRIVTIVLILGLLFFGYQRFFADTDSQAGDGGPIVEVTVPALSATAKAGEAAFEEFCASCHGKNAAGQDGVAPPLVHKIYEPSHHGDIAFVRAAKFGVRQHHWPFGNMEPVEGINERQINDIIDYVRTLQRANGIN